MKERLPKFPPITELLPQKTGSGEFLISYTHDCLKGSAEVAQVTFLAQNLTGAINLGEEMAPICTKCHDRYTIVRGSTGQEGPFEPFVSS